MSDGPEVETRRLQYPRDLCDPKKWLNFVQLTPFEKAWKHLGLTDDDLRALEIGIMLDPLRAPVVMGTGGLRKMRFAPGSSGRGKSPGLRVCYVPFVEVGLVVLVIAYAKHHQEDLSAGEKKAISGLISEIARYLEGRQK